MKPHSSAFLTFTAIILLVESSFAAPTITDVTAQQRYPWNGKVDITYTVSGDIVATANAQAAIPSLKVTATDQETGTIYTATSLSGDTDLSDGTHSLVWDMDAQGLTFVSTNVVFSVSCETAPATYCVINLSTGSSASSYSVTYLAEPPSGGFNVNTYKTTKLVLKRIEAGTFIMGNNQADNTHRVTLTKPFFLGLFETTQKQYKLVTGSNPSNFSGDKKPVEKVSYDAIRGSSNGALWPSSNAVDSSSFLGKLRARTGLDFDLPTEAQWEYACRAGTTTEYSFGDSENGDYMWYGNYVDNNNMYHVGNSSDTTHDVGTKLPNPWGLYDMHGNVREMCLNWYSSQLSYGNDPKGPSSASGGYRVSRGGSWKTGSILCSSDYRSSNYAADSKDDDGFRLALPLLTTQFAPLCFGVSSSTLIDLCMSVRKAALTETIRYSTAWETTASGAQAVIVVNGETVNTSSGSGAFAWTPSHNGTYTLMHHVMVNSEQVGATLSTTFEVSHFPATPVITPADGTILSGTASVTMSCATEGATIHYTTDGTDPTAESPVYRRFRISGRTVVKAIAVKDGLVSEIAVAEYAAGRCVDPVITPVDGTDFDHSSQSVSIAWQGEDGILRYTTDGSDPTAESPAYTAPFSIDDTTVVKAKAFGNQFFDSAIVTANLTRVWVNVATPAITAVATFTGSKTSVELSCATDNAVIHYTLDGSEPTASSQIYAEPFHVTGSCIVKAYAVCTDYLDSEIASFAIEKVWGIGDTMGDPDQVFTTGGDVPFFRVTDATAPLGEAMQSGAITHNQSSTMTTTVSGHGTVSFQWLASCEDSAGAYDWDHAEFEVDGMDVAKLDGETTWQTVLHDIAGDGPHTLVWRYVKDDMESEGDDCCRVADFLWTPVTAPAYTETQTTPEPVPYSWLDGYGLASGGDYESAALATAANGVNKVWECYVAGLVPTNAAARFEARITIGSDGTPHISWAPDLNENGTNQERVYTVEGKAELTDSWGPTNTNSRFFHVKVGMPE